MFPSTIFSQYSDINSVDLLSICQHQLGCFHKQYQLSSRLSFRCCPFPARLSWDNYENNWKTARKDVLADLAFLADLWWTIQWCITSTIHLALIPTKKPRKDVTVRWAELQREKLWLSFYNLH